MIVRVVVSHVGILVVCITEFCVGSGVVEVSLLVSVTVSNVKISKVRF